MKPTYEERPNKLEELNNILKDQNQKKDYYESVGHITTEADEIIDQAKSTHIHGYTIIASEDLGYSDEYTYFVKDKKYAEDLILEVLSDVSDLKVVPATLIFNSN